MDEAARSRARSRLGRSLLHDGLLRVDHPDLAVIGSALAVTLTGRLRHAIRADPRLVTGLTLPGLREPCRLADGQPRR